MTRRAAKAQPRKAAPRTAPKAAPAKAASAPKASKAPQRKRPTKVQKRAPKAPAKVGKKRASAWGWTGGPRPENDPQLIAKRIAGKFEVDPRTAPGKVRTLKDMSPAEIQKISDWCKCPVIPPKR